MPTFCRHNRFIERCPICRQTLPGQSPERPTRRAPGVSAPRSGQVRERKPGTARAGSRRGHAEGVRIYRDGYQRGEDDGFRSELAPGLRASADGLRLAEEIAFAHGRLLALTAAPTGLYAKARTLAGTGEQSDREQATWMCLLIAYLGPLGAPDPFAGIRTALGEDGGEPCDWASGRTPMLDQIPLGPLTSHDPARGGATLLAYRQWAERFGSQEQAFAGDPQWTPERRFERLFERLAIPGLGRAGRYELLVTLGRLGLYELRGDSLHCSGPGSTARGQAPSEVPDMTVSAAKRVFGIGDALNLERRAQAFAQAVGVPVEALDLALANWAASERATRGFSDAVSDDEALERAGTALGL